MSLARIAHTAGPWHSARMSGKTQHRGIYDSKGTLLAKVEIHSSPYVAVDSPTTLRRRADAAAMAAAPELVAALKAAVQMLDNLNSAYGAEDVDRVSKQGRAALRKAEEDLA